VATRRAQVPGGILTKLRGTCLALPEAREEVAWVGTRWAVRKKAFAHVLVVDGGWPPAYAKAAGSPGPLCLLTFRAPFPAADVARFDDPPFFRPGWWPDIVGMALDARTDWNDVAALVRQSYCVLAPKKLAALVDVAPG
jgi:hypothetical protein